MKYRKEVQQHATFLPTSSIPGSTADIGIADEETFRLIRNHFSVASCLVNTWWGRWGPWYLKCIYSKQFGKLLELWQAQIQTLQLLGSSGGTRGRPSWLVINLCVAWLLRMNLYENSRCGGVLEHHLWWRESERDCKCNESFPFTSHGSEGVQVMFC